jgi:hypothetical protein
MANPGSDFSEEERFSVFEEFFDNHPELDIVDIHIYNSRKVVEYRFGATDEWRQADLESHIPSNYCTLTDAMLEAAGQDPSRLELVMITDCDVAVFLDHRFYCTMQTK